MQFQQSEYSPQFFCNCGFQVVFSDTENLISHVDGCGVHQYNSQLYNLVENLQVYSQNAQYLQTFRAELIGILRRVETTITLFGIELQKQPSIETKAKCMSCKKIFDTNKQFDLIWYLENCQHVFCRKCISDEIDKQYLNQSGRVNCFCGKQYTIQDIQQVLGEQNYKKLMDQWALNNDNIISCVHCQAKLYFEKGSNAEVVKDEKGVQLNQKQMEYYSNNRYKCTQCQTEQCKTCKKSPYHIGLNCQEALVRAEAKKCRLCDQPTKINLQQPEALQTICDQPDCVKRAQTLCLQKLKCGHFCQGVRGDQCLPCLNSNCSKQGDEDDYCNICYTEGLKSAPCVQSQCGHVFHFHCLQQKLATQWSGPRIVFNYLKCPLCQKLLSINNPTLRPMIIKGLDLLKEVERLCMERVQLEKRMNDKELIEPTSQFYQKPLEYAMFKFCYYECFKCKKPYFGGLKDCQQAAQQQEDPKQEFKKEDLVCTKCCPIISFEDKCPKHGADYIDFKCRFCCSLALWFCHGTTHYCDPCHRNIRPKMEKPCLGGDKCPLGMPHKPNGQEMALGCSICRADRLLKG